MNSHETQQLYQKYVKHTICLSNYQQRWSAVVCGVQADWSTTAIFAILNRFLIKRLSTKSKDDKSDLLERTIVKYSSNL